jgi:hypothetical protein
MAENTARLFAYWVTYECDHCRVGELESDVGVRKAPQSFKHVCPVCGETVDLPVRYPRYRFANKLGGAVVGEISKRAADID